MILFQQHWNQSKYKRAKEQLNKDADITLSHSPLDVYLVEQFHSIVSIYLLIHFKLSS